MRVEAELDRAVVAPLVDLVVHPPQLDVAGHTVIERDANSTMVINWTVAAAGSGSSVTVKTSWQGAGGIGGFFEKTFASLSLPKIQSEVLENFKKQVEGR